jgi:2-polyprenyl-6-methoxyphenol hydroxylase-like FAD-dependent oxidoreductase
MDAQTDVVVVGASIAGCTAARLLAQQGAQVTLVEKRPDPDAYKVVCTHFIQPSALPVIRRLGLAGPLEAAGAAPGTGDIWTQAGWIRHQDEARHGYSVRRKVLDPLLRRLAVDTPGVTYRPGWSVSALVEEGDRVRGVTARDAHGGEETIAARLVVAADGRDSRTARLAGVPARRRSHGRVAYFAYFEDVELLRGHRAQMWLLDPDVAYLFPGDNGTVCVAGMVASADRIREVRRDPDATLRGLYAGLPDAPDPWAGRRISKWIGRIDSENQRRPAAARGMAFVGDAAQASDPLWGVGCGFAFQSAEWLADEVAQALHGGQEDLDAALARYRRVHRRRLAGHHWVMSDYATGRPLTPVEKLLFSAAVKDDAFAADFQRFGTREVTPERFLPGAVVRAAAINARHALARA